MDGSENTFPMDITDPSSRPWSFRPEGYLVVILAGTKEAQRAETALVAEGFAPRDFKLYTGKQILDNHEEYMGAGVSRARWWAPWLTTWRVGSSIWGTRVRIDARCGCAFLTKLMCPRHCGCSPTTTTFTRALLRL